MLDRRPASAFHGLHSSAQEAEEARRGKLHASFVDLKLFHAVLLVISVVVMMNIKTIVLRMKIMMMAIKI